MKMMRIRLTATRLAVSLAVALVFLGSSVPLASAACCVCVPKDDPNGKICVSSQALTCATMKANTQNEVLKSANCNQESLKPVECTPQAQDGLCPLGPVPEEDFGRVNVGVETKASIVPNLNVPIPGLTFSENLVTGSDGKYAVPYFAQYVAAAYRYLVGISAVAAAIMIIYGGFLYIAGSAAPQIKQGKTIITDAVIGLFILLGAYAILNTLNPDLLKLEPVRLQQITTQDFEFMKTSEAGFKNAADAAENERSAEQAPVGGGAPAIAPQTGENVSIDNIVAQGKPVERLRAYCTGAGSQAQDYDAKIQNLVRVVLGWKKTCIDEKGCAYYRGGYTNLTTGDVIGTALDIPYAMTQLKNFAGKEPTWNSDCATDWDDVKGDFYKRTLNDTRFTDFVNGGKCYQVIFDQYQKEFADRYEERGVFGGDCGTTIVQMYSCAGGQAARGSVGTYLSGAIFSSVNRPEGNDVVVWKAKDWGDYVKQVEQAGGLRFGDVFSIGRQNWQHNFMYTGGREDVPFDYFEMGQSGRDGVVGTAVNVGLNAPVGGMAAHARGTAPDFFLQVAKSRGRKESDIFPISVWRAYAYDPCTSKSECKDNQACHCTATDTKNSNAVLKNTCSQAFICHTVTIGPTICTNDEQCAKGHSCKKKTETASTGYCD